MSDSLRFDAVLGSVRFDSVRRIARSWGIAKETRKEALLEALRRALADPRQVQQHVDDLSPLGRAALAMLAEHGGRLDAEALAAMLAAAGYLVEPQPYEQYSHRVVEELIGEGVLLVANMADPTYYASYGHVAVFSDPRLLQQAPPLEVRPLVVSSSEPPASLRVRRASVVALDLLSLLQAITAQRGLQLTKAGAVRVGDLRKLARALGWGESAQRFDGLLFTQPVAALIEAFAAIGVVRVVNGVAEVADLDAFVSQARHLQVAQLLSGFAALPAWSELEDSYWSDDSDSLNAMRAALLVILAALPHDPAQFISMEVLSDAMFERVGRVMSLLGTPPVYHRVYGRVSNVDQQAIEQRIQEQLYRGWQQRERQWIAHAAAGWLYFLGVVEIGVAADQIAGLRLTELGLAALNPDRAASVAEASGPAWLVQPDFEVLVYLDQAAPAQLSLIERISERVQVQAHVARYRLTRDSVYQALERGTTLEAMLEGLQSGAGSPLPQNVAASVREWAAQRDRLTLRRTARLLELPDTAARDALLSAGISGRPLGDRFVLLTSRAAAGLPQHATVDYGRALAPCLTVTEHGRVEIARPARDLVVRAMLDRWAEPQGADAWQLTAESVALGSGRASANALLTFLEQRLTHAIPPLRAFMLRSWAGEQVAARLGRVTVLQFDAPDLAAAVASSEMFAPYVRGQLGTRTLLVDRGALEQLRRLLGGAKFAVAELDD
jgi:hypothetical protein